MRPPDWRAHLQSQRTEQTAWAEGPGLPQPKPRPRWTHQDTQVSPIHEVWVRLTQQVWDVGDVTWAVPLSKSVFVLMKQWTVCL